MADLKPFREETLTPRQAASRVKQLGAVHQPKHSKPQRHVYWAGASKTWITLEPEGANYRLGFYRGCPCSGG